jgi:hypothetical protein
MVLLCADDALDEGHLDFFFCHNFFYAPKIS